MFELMAAMTDTQSIGTLVVAAPTVLFALLGLSSLFRRPLSERSIGRAVQATSIVGLLSTLAVLVIMLARGERHVAIDLGHWIEFSPREHGSSHYHFSISFVFDRLSVPIVLMTFLLCGTIGTFATRYMHRERGYNRFFLLFSLFTLGMVVACLSGTVETLFTGWELVGLSSALLVAFFHERPAPCRNGLRIWIVYRISDAALVLAAVLMHHTPAEGNFRLFLGESPAHPWPDSQFGLNLADHGTTTLLIGFLLLFAAAGKSALLPFTGWLPRAMEGPTPSSAVFYGALSVHLGAFLLLRMSPLLEASPVLAASVVIMGLSTAVFASITSRVQTDIKSALSFASVAQVGLIVAEIGLGFHYLAIVHILGHGCLRTLQFIRAPTLLTDYRLLENALGSRLPSPQVRPGQARAWLYRLALERGYLDAILSDYVVRPFVALFQKLDWFERTMMAWLSGTRTGPGSSEAPKSVES